MKKILFTAAVLLTQVVSAQSLKEGKISNVTNLTKDMVMYENPKWSPDGTKIAYTELGYNNLYVIDANGGKRTQISSDTGVGYRYQWSADSKEILVRDTRWEKTATGMTRSHAAWAVDMQGKKVRMSQDSEYMQPASWRYTARGNKRIVCPDAQVIDMPQVQALPKALVARTVALPSNKVSFYADGENLYKIDANGKKSLINAGPSYCPALSPDGKKVAFNQVDDVCVMNIDGTGKVVIGRGFNPTWVNDSQIVFEVTSDDGHVYTSGELYIANINGTGVKAITSTPDMIEMNPNVSPDGSKIVFSSFTDGQIYVADLK